MAVKGLIHWKILHDTDFTIRCLGVPRWPCGADRALKSNYSNCLGVNLSSTLLKLTQNLFSLRKSCVFVLIYSVLLNL